MIGRLRRRLEIERLLKIQSKSDRETSERIDEQILMCKCLHWSDYKIYARLC